VIDLPDRVAGIYFHRPYSKTTPEITTVYVTEESTATGRVLRLGFAPETLGADCQSTAPKSVQAAKIGSDAGSILLDCVSGSRQGKAVFCTQ
jgi:hypothetical protein